MEKEVSLKRKTLDGFIWRFAERTGAKLVGFVVSIILARLLEPSDYGVIALITVFTMILQVFVDSGLSTALIQKKNADDIDFSTVFYTNIVFCVIIYLGMFFVAPFIASFYNDPAMTMIIRVLSTTILISGVKNVQQAYVFRTMQFKRFFFATLGGTIVAAAVGILMAYNGFGVWALVAQHLTNLLIDTLIVWITVKWRPKKLFSLGRLKGLYAFGWKMLVSGLLDTVYNNVRQLLIGKLYSASDLAYYNRAKAFPAMIIGNVNSSIDSVLLPAMSKKQDEREQLKDITRRSIKTSTYIIAPLMMGLAFVSTPLIRFLLTEKWMMSVPYMVIFCITYMFMPIHTSNLNAIKAMGRSDIFLKLEIIKKVVGIVALLATIWISVMAMAYSLLFTSVISQIINSWPNRKLLNYGYLEQLKDILPSILLAVFMGSCVYPIQYIGLPDIVTLVIQVLLGASIYLAGSFMLKFDAFYYVADILNLTTGKVIKRKKND